jgi:amidophosphoribosyltransferase
VTKGELCRACFDGVYPVDLPEPQFLGKYMLELDTGSPTDADGLAVSLSGSGAADALSRP